MDFTGKKLHEDSASRPTTGESTPKKSIICLYLAPDLPTCTPIDEKMKLVLSDPSDGMLQLTDSTRSTTPNPKRQKYQIMGRQLPSGRNEKVLVRQPTSSNTKATDGSLSAPSVRRHRTPPTAGVPGGMEHSDDEETVESLKAMLLDLRARYKAVDERLAEHELWRCDMEDKMVTLRKRCTSKIRRLFEATRFANLYEAPLP